MLENRRKKAQANPHLDEKNEVYHTVFEKEGENITRERSQQPFGKGRESIEIIKAKPTNGGRRKIGWEGSCSPERRGEKLGGGLERPIWVSFQV